MKQISRQAYKFANHADTGSWEETCGAARCLRRRLSCTNFLQADFDDEIGQDVRRGLAREPKALPSKYFYDERGSRLFDEICRLPEYYPTRTEISILRASAQSIMSFFARQPGDLVEIGCGSDLKIRQLLERVDPDHLSHIRYVPMDISADCLLQSSCRLLADFGALHIHGLVADFTRHLEHIPAGRKMIVFFGGTLGNFIFEDSIALLAALAHIMGAQDRLILGLDMIKEKEILEAAYNDSRGVTADFNLNILRHINRRLGADFDLSAFEHTAFWNEPMERIEMHLQARRAVKVCLTALGMVVPFTRGETIHTEISQKFSRRSAQERFLRAGLQASAWHTDPNGWFSIVELRKLQPLDFGYSAAR